jgi:LuxR family maltose regulon positive regulatory protein
MRPQSGFDLKEYVHNLSGSQRPIAAYLAEMLDGLPADLVDVMLRTAILDRLSGSLCEAVTGSSLSRTILATLAQRQMLLTSLDNDGVWFRYHTLLSFGVRYEGERALTRTLCPHLGQLLRRSLRENLA